jgi:hypothetical protein
MVKKTDAILTIPDPHNKNKSCSTSLYIEYPEIHALTSTLTYSKMRLPVIQLIHTTISKGKITTQLVPIRQRKPTTKPEYQ